MLYLSFSCLCINVSSINFLLLVLRYFIGIGSFMYVDFLITVLNTAGFKAFGWFYFTIL